MGWIPQDLQDELEGKSSTTIKPKRGTEIFEGTDYPTEWEGFIGQRLAKEQLRVQVMSSLARNARMEHTLIESGIHGVGKTTLAHLLAFHGAAGLVQTSGPLTAEEAKKLMKTMSDRDVLFIDEAHTLGTKCDWLLPFMTEGKLYTQRGAEQMPDITIVAATTDAGKLPLTLLSRFMVKPVIEQYSEDEAALIAGNLAVRMKVDLAESYWGEVATAAAHNPRVMRAILTQIRDLKYALPESHPNMEKALEYAGVSPDGLSIVARQILSILLVATKNTLSMQTIRDTLGEPGPLRHHEQALLQRRLIEITGQGRKLTQRGEARIRAEYAK